MIAIIDYVTFIFRGIVDLLSIKPFPDFNVSILQIILTGFVLKYILTFVFGGFKEVDIATNWVNSAVVNSGINNYKRKKALSSSEAELNKLSGKGVKRVKPSRKERKEMEAILSEFK